MTNSAKRSKVGVSFSKKTEVKQYCEYSWDHSAFYSYTGAVKNLYSIFFSTRKYYRFQII